MTRTGNTYEPSGPSDRRLFLRSLKPKLCNQAQYFSKIDKQKKSTKKSVGRNIFGPIMGPQRPDSSPPILISRIVSFSYSVELRYEILSFSVSLKQVNVLGVLQAGCVRFQTEFIAIFVMAVRLNHK